MNKVPQVAEVVPEYRHLTVRLLSRCLRESNASCKKCRMVQVEIVRLQKEADPSAGLVADSRALSLTFAFGKNQPCFTAFWRHHHPTLSFAARRVLDQLEPELADEESNSLIIIRNHQCDRLQAHVLGTHQYEGIVIQHWR